MMTVLSGLFQSSESSASNRLHARLQILRQIRIVAGRRRPACVVTRVDGRRPDYRITLSEEMNMDPNNPVVKLCAEGMQAEGDGRFDDARALFEQAWAAGKDDFDACVAAHFVARRQETPEQMLEWNRIALERADAVGDERVVGFYPSLYLNMGYSFERLGDPDEARRYYAMGAGLLDNVPEGPYKDVLRGGIAEGQGRVG
jgi:tetratricopeptide (TPR) repeat protein